MFAILNHFLAEMNYVAVDNTSAAELPRVKGNPRGDTVKESYRL